MISVQRLLAPAAIASLIAAACFVLPFSVHAAATGGSLIKCPDYSAVYYLADDGKRYVFPNERIYFTYFENFDDIVSISCERLGGLEIGGNVPYRAGTRLLKIASMSPVYVIEPGAILRQLTDETQAEHLFGSDWKSQIDVIPDSLFSSYTIGEFVDSGEIPQGTIMRDDTDGSLYIVDENNVAVLLGTRTEAAERFPVFDSFLVPSSYILNGVQVNYERSPGDSLVMRLLNRARPIDVAIEDVIDVYVPDLEMEIYR